LLWKHTYADNADSPSTLTKRPDVKAKEMEKKKKTVTHYLLEKHFITKRLYHTHTHTYFRIQSLEYNHFIKSI